MDILEVKQMLRRQSSYLTHGWDKTSTDYLDSRMRNLLSQWEAKQGVQLDPEVQACAIQQLCNDFVGYGPLQDLLDDAHVTEIMVNGYDQIYVEYNGRKELSAASFDDETHLQYIVDKMMAPSGRHMNEASPCVDFSLPDGSRVNITIPPISVGKTCLTIRKLSSQVVTLESLVELGTMDIRMANFLVCCLRGGMNMVFAGATGTGKTTTINILMNYIEDGERIITIEDTLELSPPQGNAVRLLTRPADLEGRGEISLRYLFTNALRMRPTRIILGEIRGAEAMEYIQALNSGHRGTIAVLHAATPRDAITRLETLAMYAGLSLPGWSIRQQIASGLNLIIQHEQLPDGSRKISCISELVGVQDEQIMLRDIYRYEIESTSEETGTLGRFLAVQAPTFRAELASKGVQMDDALFVNP